MFKGKGFNYVPKMSYVAVQTPSTSECAHRWKQGLCICD